jgi:hypothetical protein
MPTDPAILAQLQTLWGEPVTETTSEADVASAFVASEWLPSPIAPVRLPDSPATWNAEAAELVAWFQNAGGSLPFAPFDLKKGVGVVDPALWFRTLDADIATGPNGPRGRQGALEDDLKSLRSIVCR